MSIGYTIITTIIGKIGTVLPAATEFLFLQMAQFIVANVATIYLATLILGGSCMKNTPYVNVIDAQDAPMI